MVTTRSQSCPPSSAGRQPGGGRVCAHRPPCESGGLRAGWRGQETPRPDYAGRALPAATVEQPGVTPSSTDTGEETRSASAAPETAGRPAGSGAKPREGDKGRHAGPNLMLLKNHVPTARGRLTGRGCCLEGLSVHRLPGLWPLYRWWRKTGRRQEGSPQRRPRSPPLPAASLSGSPGEPAGRGGSHARPKEPVSASGLETRAKDTLWAASRPKAAARHQVPCSASAPVPGVFPQPWGRGCPRTAGC